jgi:hypothetical protein
MRGAMPSSGSRAALIAAMFALIGCAGARHRKPAGPPPEYEPPDDPGAYQARDGGTVQAAPPAVTGETRGADSRDGDAGASVLTSPDVRR